MPILGDAPIEEQYVEMMNAAMRAVDELFNGDERPRKVGIVMLVFPYGEASGRCNYISNGANRKDMVVLLREQAARFEGQPELKGRA